MAGRNGSGVFTVTNPDFVSGTTISSSEMDANFSDVSTALTGSIAADGQTTITGNLPMNSKKLTGLAAGSSAGDSVRYEQVLVGLGVKGGDIVSASPLVVDTDGSYFDVTGTTGFAAMQVGANRMFTLQFDGALIMTHHATNLDLPGAANITTVAGDVATFQSTGANTVQCVGYTKVDGTAVAGAGSVAISSSTENLAGTATTVPNVAGVKEMASLVVQNVQAGNYTCVLLDQGKQIYHASDAGASDVYTIPANASVAYEIGTVLSFVNMSSATVSIAITSDTMYLVSDGTTGSRTLAQYGMAVATKLTATTWLISGSALS
tara:strand:+ start:200 stop:1162 length:963 start_codon:yes stop_codon:yes gene_type:complete